MVLVATVKLASKQEDPESKGRVESPRKGEELHQRMSGRHRCSVAGMSGQVQGCRFMTTEARMNEVPGFVSQMSVNNQWLQNLEWFEAWSSAVLSLVLWFSQSL